MLRLWRSASFPLCALTQLISAPSHIDCKRALPRYLHSGDRSQLSSATLITTLATGCSCLEFRPPLPVKFHRGGSSPKSANPSRPPPSSCDSHSRKAWRQIGGSGWKSWRSLVAYENATGGDDASSLRVVDLCHGGWLGWMV